MTVFRTLPVLVLAGVMPLAAQKTNDLIRELQRDLLQTQADVRSLTSKFDSQIAVMNTLLQQALQQATDANKAVAVLDSRLRDSLKEQQNLVSVPVAGLGTKVDQMSLDFAALKENVSELGSRMTKLSTQLSDVLAAVQTMKQPAPPPPTSPTSSEGPPQGVTAQQLYQMALKDRQAGNLDLALTEFQDFMRWFGNTESAPEAQYYVGDIYYLKEDYDQAISGFDQVLERFPENSKTPDALFMKGMALYKSGKKAQAAQVFAEVIAKYPTSDVAGKARSMRRGMGLSASSTNTKRRK